jgi:hypothetical protein
MTWNNSKLYLVKNILSLIKAIQKLNTTQSNKLKIKNHAIEPYFLKKVLSQSLKLMVNKNALKQKLKNNQHNKKINIFKVKAV